MIKEPYSMICFMMVFLLRERERALNRSFWLLSGCFIQSEAFPSSTSIYGCKAGKTCSIVAFGIPLCFQYFTLTNDRWKFHWQAATSMCVCVFFLLLFFFSQSFSFSFFICIRLDFFETPSTCGREMPSLLGPTHNF